MRSFLSSDSPFMRFLQKVTNLLCLNLLTVLCSLPLITFGAAITAMHAMIKKIVAEDEYFISKPFFREFKRNFKNSTLLWLIVLAAAAVLAGDILILRGLVSTVLRGITIYVVIVAAAVLCFICLYLFPMQAWFDNSPRVLLKNSLILAFAFFFRTLALLVIQLIPFVLLALSPRMIPIFVAFGFSFPGYFCYLLYRPVFQRFEIEEEKGREDPEETEED